MHALRPNPDILVRPVALLSGTRRCPAAALVRYLLEGLLCGPALLLTGTSQLVRVQPQQHALPEPPHLAPQFVQCIVGVPGCHLQQPHAVPMHQHARPARRWQEMDGGTAALFRKPGLVGEAPLCLPRDIGPPSLDQFPVPVRLAGLPHLVPPLLPGHLREGRPSHMQLSLMVPCEMTPVRLPHCSSP